MGGVCSPHGRKVNCVHIFLRKPVGKIHLEDLGVYDRIIL
jgi:hypothetical protein